MRQKVLTGALAGIMCILFVLGAGCTSLKTGTQVNPVPTPLATEMQTVVATPVPTPAVRTDIQVVSKPQFPVEIIPGDKAPSSDIGFNALFLKSADVIANKTGLVIEAMVPGTTGPKAAYSPTVLYLRAEDLGHTSEDYYNQMLTIRADTPENEAKRVAYIQFLYTAKNAAYNIADAAEAESFGDYQNALSYLRVAKIDLQNIREDPDLPPTTPYNTLNTFLNEYIGRMQQEVNQQQNLAALGGSKNPTISVVVSRGGGS
jgi:hypothetical protein